MAIATSWQISDFKSLLDVRLDFPHLGVLAGANSSGKSSILQTLLLLAQSNRTSETLVLNGPLVRLGQPRDVVRSGQNSVSVEFGVSTRDNVDNEPDLGDWTVSVSLSPNPNVKSLSAISFRISSETGDVILEATSKHMKSTDVEWLSRRFPESSILRIGVVNGVPASPRSYLILSGFTPVSLVTHRSKQQIRDSFTIPDADSELWGDVGIGRYIARRATGLFADDEEIGDLLQEFRGGREIPRAEPHDFADELKRLTNEQRSELADAIVRKRSDHDFGVIDQISSPGFLEGRFFYLMATDLVELRTLLDWSQIVKYLSLSVKGLEGLSRRIQYLGPLRDEPRVLNSSWDQRSPALPVGIRGELTAEILTSRRTDLVPYCDWLREPCLDSLPTAVSRWANYLGIGDAVTVLDEGKLGRGVNIEVNGTVRDLTTIGVGASQLLPVLVACLGVRPNSLMLVEQPELHLHPAVQSKLADFFMFARPDITLLIETHSEYLVTRIRRRVAEGAASADEITFLFAEQIDGRTTVRELGLTDFGDIDEWPVGFFDEQDTESRLIVQAIARRLASDAASDSAR